MDSPMGLYMKCVLWAWQFLQGGPQVSLTISSSQVENMINHGSTAITKFEMNDKQLFLELGPWKSLVYVVLNGEQPCCLLIAVSGPSGSLLMQATVNRLGLYFNAHKVMFCFNTV